MIRYPLFNAELFWVSLYSPVLCQELAHGFAVLQGYISAATCLGGIVLLLGATTVCSGVVGDRSNRSFICFSGISRQCFLGNLLFIIGSSALLARW